MKCLFFVRLQPAFMLTGLALFLFACQPLRPPHYTRMSSDSLQIPQVVNPFTCPQFEKGLFKTSLDIKTHHLTGLMFIKKIPATDLDTAQYFRVVFSNEFGMTYFDMETGMYHFRINYCFEPLNNKMLWKLLRNDFNLLFNPAQASEQDIRYIHDEGRYVAVKRKQGMIKRWDLFTTSGDTLVEVRAGSNLADQTLIAYRNFQDGFPSRITISNSLVRLQLSLFLLSIN